MATVQELEQKFMRAHEANDAPAAKALADEIKRLRSVQSPGLMDRAKSAYNTYLKPGVDELTDLSNASDMGRIMVDAASLGGADYMAGPEQKKLTDEARARVGPGAVLGDITGGVVSPALPVKATGVVGAGLRAGQSGVQSTVDAYTHGERDPMDLAKAFGTGSGASAALEGVAKPITNWIGRRKARSEAKGQQTYKSGEELGAAKKAKYKLVDDSKAFYPAKALRQLHAEFQNMGLNPQLDSKATALVDEMKRKWRGKDMTPKQLDEVRQDIRKTLGVDKREQGVAQRMIAGMDKFTDRTPAHDSRGVNTAIDQTLKEARDLAAREARHGIVEQTAKDAARQSKAGRFNPFTPSPESADVKGFSTLEQKIEKGKVKSKFTDDEKAGINKIYEGDWIRDLGARAEPVSVRGKFGGPIALAGMGLNAIPGVGTAASMAAPVVMAGAEALSTLGQNRTKGQIEDLLALIRDPSGKGISRDAKPEDIAKMRDMLSRMMGAGVRASNRGEQ